MKKICRKELQMRKKKARGQDEGSLFLMSFCVIASGIKAASMVAKTTNGSSDFFQERVALQDEMN